MLSELTSQATNVTTHQPPVTLTVEILDYLCLLIASVGYGGYLLPVKHFDTGDGFFFQFVLCTGLWLWGFPIFWYRNFPSFLWLPLFGGFLWSTANLCTVWVIALIGIGLGSLFWNSAGLLAGWAYARYGWFGVVEEIPADPVMNYIGLLRFFFFTINFFHSRGLFDLNLRCSVQIYELSFI